MATADIAEGLVRRRYVGGLAVVFLAAGLLVPVSARAENPEPIDCVADVGDPEPGTTEWDLADNNNRYCAAEGWAIYQSNPAQVAANAANQAQGSVLYRGDPFREPLLRWADVRGDAELVTWTNRGGRVSDALLLSPLDTGAGPFPGVIIPCHSCFTTAVESGLFWVAEALAEAGYLVLVPYVGGNDIDSTVDATDYFVSTPDSPNPHNPEEFNPWFERLDADRLGIAGHSGAGGLALNVGHTDPRYSAVVSFDPAGPGIADLSLSTPTMVHVADYQGNLARPVGDLDDGLPLPVLTFAPYGPNAVNRDKPEPEPGSRYTYFDTLREAGVDTMQVAIRAATHIDWGRPGGGTFSTYGEMVATYYTLAWFDRHLRAEPDALDRLTAAGTFDGSADPYSIGTGFFDADKARDGGSLEAGNVPIALEGMSVRNRLSFLFPTRYHLDGGALTCDDLRAGCQ